MLWGAWQGTFLVAERAGIDGVLRRGGVVARLLSHVYALCVVMPGWVPFRCDTLAHAVGYFQALAGFAHGDAQRHPVAQHLDPQVFGTLVVGVVFSTPLARTIDAWRDGMAAKPGWAATGVLGADIAWLACVDIMSGAFLAAGTYNPFIYFRF